MKPGPILVATKRYSWPWYFSPEASEDLVLSITFVTILRYNISVAQNLTILVFAEKVRKSGRFSKIFIFGPTKMCNTSKKSSEKSTFNSEIIFEVIFIKLEKKLFHFFDTKNSWV